MNWKEYQENAKRTMVDLNSNQGNNFHMLMGMQTELGELTDPFKKNFAYGKEIDWVNVKEELADMAWYIANFCTINNIDFEEILETNIAKLKARYPNKFTQEEAINRNLDMERKILEGG